VPQVGGRHLQLVRVRPQHLLVEPVHGRQVRERRPVLLRPVPQRVLHEGRDLHGHLLIEPRLRLRQVRQDLVSARVRVPERGMRQLQLVLRHTILDHPPRLCSRCSRPHSDINILACCSQAQTA
jgi:hypothetical protein